MFIILGKQYITDTICMIKKFIEVFSVSVVRFRIWVILFSLLLAVGSLYCAKDLKFNNSNEMWFIEDDKTLLDYQSLLATFGDDEFLIVGIENKDKTSLFNQQDIEKIKQITDFLKEEEYVTKVQSLSKAEIITGDEEGLTVRKLFKRFDLTKKEYQEKEKIALNDRLLKGLLINEDATFSIITGRVKHVEGTIDFKVVLSNKLKQFIKDINQENNYNIFLSGGPILDESFLTHSLNDQMKLMPVLTLVIVITLFYSFRTIFGTILPLGVIFGTIVMVYGYMGVLGHDMNMLNAIVPIIILAIGVADAVHILVDYYHEVNKGHSSKIAAENSIKNLFTPCFFTSITTSIGFLSFSTSKLVPLKELGGEAAFGVFAAFLLSVTLLPALLSFLKPKPKKAERITENNLFYNQLHRISTFTPRQNKVILTVFGIITMVFLYFVLQVKVDANAMNYFKDSSVIKQETSYIDSRLKGIFNIEIVVDSGKDGGVKEPEFLKKLEVLVQHFESFPDYGKIISLLDFIKKMNKVMHEDREEFYKIPDTREEVAQYLLLYSFSSPDEDLTDIVDYNYRYTRISARVPIMNTSRSKELTQETKTFIKQELPELSITLTGLAILFNALDIYILDSQITAFSTAFFLIFFMMILVFKSLKYGILSMIPNLFPVFAAAGIMGMFGIYLEFGTVMVACVVIGIGVDDSIHYLNRYLRKKRSGYSRRESIAFALHEAGKPIVFTSVILFFGFFVLLFGSFKINILFGLLVCVAILFALLADLFLLSSIMLTLPDKNSPVDGRGKKINSGGV
ncbi:MAG: MMPL family transporter [Nitrospinae bacterium]|nr:MMPL family transporter [Nitrospinota bacterium]